MASLTAGTYGWISLVGPLASESLAAAAYGEARWPTGVRAGKAAGTDAWEASLLTDAATSWKSRSLSTLVLNGMDQPSVETVLYALPPLKTAGGAAKANLSNNLVFCCCTRSFIRPENIT